MRLAGYIGFALFAGVAAFVLLCAPDTSSNITLQALARAGLLGGAVAAVAAILVQGPYTAGVDEPCLDHRLVQQTLATPFGAAMMWRLALCRVLAVLAWRLPGSSTSSAAGSCPPG